MNPNMKSLAESTARLSTEIPNHPINIVVFNIDTDGWHYDFIDSTALDQIFDLLKVTNA